MPGWCRRCLSFVLPYLWKLCDGITFVILELHFWDLVHCLLIISFCFGSAHTHTHACHCAHTHFGLKTLRNFFFKVFSLFFSKFFFKSFFHISFPISFPISLSAISFKFLRDFPHELNKNQSCSAPLGTLSPQSPGEFNQLPIHF